MKKLPPISWMEKQEARVRNFILKGPEGKKIEVQIKYNHDIHRFIAFYTIPGKFEDKNGNVSCVDLRALPGRLRLRLAETFNPDIKEVRERFQRKNNSNGVIARSSPVAVIGGLTEGIFRDKNGNIIWGKDEY